ncbi:unnamed protein product [Leptosia nina]|uniref:N-acetyltransferase domain-containing protein n=1 Tax=Leptosia nina TaxID=320188 RepID=A0AAV1JWQ2_9NEOP
MSYTISPVVSDDVESVLKFLKRTFYLDEPILRAVDYCQTGNDDTHDLDEYCRHSLPGCSFQAKDEDGNLIGVLVCDRCPVVNPTDCLTALKDCKSPKYKTVIRMQIMREIIAEIWNQYPNDSELIEIKMAATDPKWRNKGVMNKLMGVIEKTARDLGVRLLRIETSSAFSAKSAESKGFKCIFSRPYTEFQFDGKPFIITEPPHLDDRIYIKELF